MLKKKKKRTHLCFGRKWCWCQIYLLYFNVVDNKSSPGITKGLLDLQSNVVVEKNRNTHFRAETATETPLIIPLSQINENIFVYTIKFLRHKNERGFCPKPIKLKDLSPLCLVPQTSHIQRTLKSEQPFDNCTFSYVFFGESATRSEKFGNKHL